MSSDEEYTPDNEGEDECISSVSSGESSDFIASDDDESSESNEDVSYHQPPELSDEEDCKRTQLATPRTARQCTKETNEKMIQMLDEEELSDDEVFGSDNDTQDMNLCAPNFKEGVPSSEDEVDEQNHNLSAKKKKRKRICDSDDHELDDESDDESDDNKSRVSIRCLFKFIWASV